MANMNPKILQESQSVERKEAFNEKALRTICSFLNTDGGSLYLPIRDNGTILNSPISDKELQGIIHQIVELLGVQPTIYSHDWHRKIFPGNKRAKKSNSCSFKGYLLY